MFFWVAVATKKCKEKAQTDRIQKTANEHLATEWLLDDRPTHRPLCPFSLCLLHFISYFPNANFKWGFHFGSLVAVFFYQFDLHFLCGVDISAICMRKLHSGHLWKLICFCDSLLLCQKLKMTTKKIERRKTIVEKSWNRKLFDEKCTGFSGG